MYFESTYIWIEYDVLLIICEWQNYKSLLLTDHFHRVPKVV